MQPMLNCNEVAMLLKVHPKTIQRMATRGELPARRAGRGWRFAPQAIEEWMRGDSILLNRLCPEMREN